jgi:hypothetical protein
MKSEIYTCDECGKQKQESNHWWILAQAAPAPFPPCFSLLPMNPIETAELGISEHLCSESCAIKALSKWMSKVQEKPQRAETPVQRETEDVQ